MSYLTFNHGQDFDVHVGEVLSANGNTAAADMAVNSARKVVAIVTSTVAGSSAKLQGSNDNATWTDIGSSVAVEANETKVLEIYNPGYRYVRVNVTLGDVGSMAAHIFTTGYRAHRG